MVESYAKSLEKLREQFENLPDRTEWPDPERPPTEVIRFFANAGQWLYCAIEQGAITIPDWPGYMEKWPGWEYESFAVAPEHPEPVAVGGTDHWLYYDAYWPACLGTMVANAAVPVNSDRPGEFGWLVTQWHDEWLPAVPHGGVPARFFELPLCPPDLWREMCRVTEQALAYFANQLELPGATALQASAQTTEPKIDDDAIMSPSTLAVSFGVKKEALRKRLDRLRRTDKDCYVENVERGPREAKFLYRVGAIRHVIESLRASSEASS